MANIIAIDDSFVGLALNQTLHGRVPTVNVGSTWTVEGASTNINGGGNGDIKFAISGAAAKLNSYVLDYAVQIELVQFVAAEVYSIFLRDTFNTTYPRRGNVLTVQPLASPPNGLFSIGTVSEYNITWIQQNIVWPFNSGKNIIAFEAIGNNFRVIINNAVALSLTNSTVAFDATATKNSIVCNNRGTGLGRIERYTVYDSIAITASSEYPVVYFG